MKNVFGYSSFWYRKPNFNPKSNQQVILAKLMRRTTALTVPVRTLS